MLCGSLRFLDFSLLARHLQSPRGAHRLLAGAASPMVADFSISGSLVTPEERNEAESSSLALWLTSSPSRASPWGLLLSVPSWLHAGHLVGMLITFHINREVRLGLTHQRHLDTEMGGWETGHLSGKPSRQLRRPPLSHSGWSLRLGLRSSLRQRLPEEVIRGCILAISTSDPNRNPQQ